MNIDDKIISRFTKAQDSLVIQASDLSLETMANMVERGAIDIAPHYQRRERWTNKAQSALIESFLLNVPVPPIYLAEEDFGTYSVIDGKQRLTSIAKFMRDDLPLSNLESFPGLEGARFSDLPLELKNALQVRPYIRAITLLRQSDPNLKYEVFIRLNTGGEALLAQEIRNVAFSGPLNDLIYQLSGHEFLKRQLKITSDKSPAYHNMTDVETVLRFLTLSDSWQSFSGDLRRSMDLYMQKHRDPGFEFLEKKKESFERSIDYCRRIWGDVAFKRPQGDGWRDQFLAGMYDAQILSINEISIEHLPTLEKNKEFILEVTEHLFHDSDFESAVRQGTNTPSRLQYRISSVLRILNAIIN